MPKQGFKSLTIRDEIYDYFQDIYTKNETEFHLVGITTYAGFVTAILDAIIRTKKGREAILEAMHDQIRQVFERMKL